MIELTYERCVRPRAVTASCQACVDACPTQAVSLKGPKKAVEISVDACSSCGLCQAACPTEAIHGVFDVEAVLQAAGAELRCGAGGLPCVGALPIEALLRLALQAPRALVATKTCAHGSTGHSRARVDEVNALLQVMKVPHAVTWTEEGPPAPRTAPAPPPEPVPARRQFIGMFVPRAVPPEPVVVSQPARLDVAALRTATVPQRRRRLLAEVPEALTPASTPLASEQISFASMKQIDPQTCTACMACVTACPTGALSASRLRDTIRFDANRCVKCSLCHDVCEPKALTLAPQFELTAFLEIAPVTLVQLKLRSCSECGRPYKADGRAMCPACREQDEEAHALRGLE